MRQIQLWTMGGRIINIDGEDGHEMLMERGPGGAMIPARPITDAERRAVQIEDMALRIRSQDVYCLDSCLVSDLMSAEPARNNPVGHEFTNDNVSNLLPDPSDWDLGQCKEWLEDNGHDMPDPNPWGMDRDDLASLLGYDLEDARGNDYSAMTDDVLRDKAIEEMDVETIHGLDDWRDAVRDNADQAEIYEWYRVSRWLAGKLSEIGECVLDNAYGHWWGRQGTGQDNIMDGTFQKVAAALIDETAALIAK